MLPNREEVPVRIPHAAFRVVIMTKIFDLFVLRGAEGGWVSLLPKVGKI